MTSANPTARPCDNCGDALPADDHPDGECPWTLNKGRDRWRAKYEDAQRALDAERQAHEADRRALQLAEQSILHLEQALKEDEQTIDALKAARQQAERERNRRMAELNEITPAYRQAVDAMNGAALGRDAARAENEKLRAELAALRARGEAPSGAACEATKRPVVACLWCGRPTTHGLWCEDHCGNGTPHTHPVRPPPPTDSPPSAPSDLPLDEIEARANAAEQTRVSARHVDMESYFKNFYPQRILALVAGIRSRDSAIEQLKTRAEFAERERDDAYGRTWTKLRDENKMLTTDRDEWKTLAQRNFEYGAMRDRESVVAESELSKLRADNTRLELKLDQRTGEVVGLAGQVTDLTNERNAWKRTAEDAEKGEHGDRVRRWKECAEAFQRERDAALAGKDAAERDGRLNGLRDAYELCRRRAFQWGGWPPPPDEPDHGRRNARMAEAHWIEHELRAIAGRLTEGAPASAPTPETRVGRAPAVMAHNCYHFTNGETDRCSHGWACATCRRELCSDAPTKEHPAPPFTNTPENCTEPHREIAGMCAECGSICGPIEDGEETAKEHPAPPPVDTCTVMKWIAGDHIGRMCKQPRPCNDHPRPGDLNRLRAERDEARRLEASLRAQRESTQSEHDRATALLAAQLKAAQADARRVREALALARADAVTAYRHIDADREMKALKVIRTITDAIDAALATLAPTTAGDES